MVSSLLSASPAGAAGASGFFSSSGVPKNAGAFVFTGGSGSGLAACGAAAGAAAFSAASAGVSRTAANTAPSFAASCLGVSFFAAGFFSGFTPLISLIIALSRAISCCSCCSCGRRISGAFFGFFKAGSCAGCGAVGSCRACWCSIGAASGSAVGFSTSSRSVSSSGSASAPSSTSPVGISSGFVSSFSGVFARPRPKRPNFRFCFSSGKSLSRRVISSGRFTAVVEKNERNRSSFAASSSGVRSRRSLVSFGILVPPVIMIGVPGRTRYACCAPR